MVSDALAGDRLIAMALPRNADAGDEDAGDDNTGNHHGAAGPLPRIHPVVCIGRIIHHERLADGRYHLLLEGQHRARILSERLAGIDHARKHYRIGRLGLLAETNGMEIDLEKHRLRIGQLLVDRSDTDPSVEPFRELIVGPTSTSIKSPISWLSTCWSTSD